MTDAQRAIRGIRDKHMRKIIREAARDEHWEVSLTSGNHIRLRHDSGTTIITAYSSSDWRTVKNLQANIRRVERGGKPR